MFADTPLVRPQTLIELRTALARGAAVAVLGFRPANPTGYGRLLTRGDELMAIREERDATPAERKIALLQWRADGAFRQQARSPFSIASAMPMPRANTISPTRLPSPAIWA